MNQQIILYSITPMLNSNIRCIEIEDWLNDNISREALNSNIRCIEMQNAIDSINRNLVE